MRQYTKPPSLKYGIASSSVLIPLDLTDVIQGPNDTEQIHISVSRMACLEFCEACGPNWKKRNILTGP
jgi:hypothetical protein